MMKMRKYVLIVLTIILGQSIKAQNNTRVSEIGFIASDFNHSGLVYKIGTERSLWRFSILNLAGGKSDVKDNPDNTTTNSSGTSKDFSLEARIGREYRRSLLKRVVLVCGGDISFSYIDASANSTYIMYTGSGYNSHTSYLSYRRYVPGINLVTGLNYKFDGPFTLGIEWSPYFKYSIGSNYGDGSDLISTNSGLSYGIFDIPMQISLTIRLK